MLTKGGFRHPSHALLHAPIVLARLVGHGGAFNRVRVKQRNEPYENGVGAPVVQPSIWAIGLDFEHYARDGDSLHSSFVSGGPFFLL